MTPYTVPIDESQTQLLQLIDRTKNSHRPLMLTREGTAEPMAVILEIEAYKQTQRHQQRLYHLQLSNLNHWLDKVESHWEDCAIRQACVSAWQHAILPLWEVTPETVKELCAALQLSVKYLTAEKLSAAQITALRYCLELLRDTEPDESALEKAHQLLIESGMPPLFIYEDNKLLQMYLDEL